MLTKEELIAYSVDALEACHAIERTAKFSNKPDGMWKLLAVADEYRKASRIFMAAAHAGPWLGPVPANLNETVRALCTA